MRVADGKGCMVFYESFYLAGMSMPAKQRLAYYDAIFEYCFNETEPVDLKGVSLSAFILAKPNIDANAKRRKKEKERKIERQTKTVCQRYVDGMSTPVAAEEEVKENVKEKVKVNVNEDVDDKVNDNSPSATDTTVSTVDTVSEERVAVVDVSQIEFVLSEYARICPSLQPATSLTDKRIAAIRTLLEKFPLDRVIELFTMAEANDFLKGGGSLGWTASFDWLISLDHASRVLEGGYKKFVPPPEQPQATPDSGSFDTDEAVKASKERSDRYIDEMLK